MNVSVAPGSMGGTVKAIPSKSQAHRALIFAAISENASKLICRGTSEDIDATVRCLNNLGADIKRCGEIIEVVPIAAGKVKKAVLDCGESGSTLRFVVPLAAALGIETDFVMHGRLPDRPMGPIVEVLEKTGVSVTKPKREILRVSGKLNAGEFEISGSVSSQFISGLMFALSVLKGKSKITITGRMESAGYIKMTSDVMKCYGFEHTWTDNVINIDGFGGKAPELSEVEGDWSNGALWLCAGALLNDGLKVTGLDISSSQGDREIVEILKRFGANVDISENTVYVSAGKMHGITVDAAQIPDIIPAVAVVAAHAEGATKIINAGRLRIKESDRIASVVELLTAMGGKITAYEDSMTIEHSELSGAKVSAVGDHRIAMAAALASLTASTPVHITGAECVNKSYPAFWNDWKSLGGNGKGGEFVNSLGKKMTLTIFGQSHSPAIGVVIDGFPSGLQVDTEALAEFMARRAPGRNEFSTKRKEADSVEILSGLFAGKTCGAPIAAEIRNGDTRPVDYANIANIPRPGHADFTAWTKSGGFNDRTGGGQFSGRLTAPLCIAGGLCMQLLEKNGIKVFAHIASIKDVEDVMFDPVYPDWDIDKEFPVISREQGEKMKEVINTARLSADSVGGVIECAVTGLPAGVGEPMFEGVENRIAQAVFGIPAIKGIEFGAGFASAKMLGSENNDAFAVCGGKVVTKTNNCGGILGGITNGMPVIFRAAVKPTPSIGTVQKSVDLENMTEVEMTVRGRHDPCIVQRAVTCIEAAAAVTVTDMLIENGYNFVV